MNLEFQSISIRNFLSFGNIPQTIELNNKQYEIIVGLNKDKSDSNSDRNGAGKSSIFEAIHYALFGKSIGNKVNLGNLINNINKKNMVVSLKFKKNDVNYEIIRGRSPSILKFLKNGDDIIIDESQGDSRETQKEIEKVLGMNEDVYNQIVCLSCKVPVFLDQSTTNQKNIIEKILGIDVISKKINSLKELIKNTKNELNNEQFKITTIKTQNDNLLSSINKQYEDMNNDKNAWYEDIKNKISQTEYELSQLSKINIDQEMENFKLLEKYLELEGVNKQNQQLKDSLMVQIQNYDINIKRLIGEFQKIQDIDFEKEKEILEYNELQHKKQLEYQKIENEHNVNKQKLQLLLKEFDNISSDIKKNQDLIDNTNPSVCPTCGSPMNVEKYNLWKNGIQEKIKELSQHLHQVDLQILELNSIISNFSEQTFTFKTSRYESLSQLLKDENNVKQNVLELQDNENKKNNLLKELEKINIVDLGEKPSTYYNSYEEIMNHVLKVKTTKSNLDLYNQQLLSNPFEQQEKSIEMLKGNIIEVDESTLNKLIDDLNHQEFLLKLLNSPNSFIRKTILDKSLEFLNAKIEYYLQKLGSLHSVSFNNDMSISISLMDIEYGYVSSGEMGRISSALTLAFRDAWEALNDCHINLLAIDEVIDRMGLDTSGVENMVNVLQNYGDKNIMLVTHNELLINQASELLKIIKEQGFTTVEEETI